MWLVMALADSPKVLHMGTSTTMALGSQMLPTTLMASKTIVANSGVGEGGGSKVGEGRRPWEGGSSRAEEGGSRKHYFLLV